MDVIKTIIHDLTGYKRETVDVARGDRGSRVVRCRLTAAGSPWEVPAGCRVQVAYELPDGTPGLYEELENGTAAGIISGNTVDLRIAKQLTQQSGVAEVSGVLIGPDGAQLATWPMRLNVVGPKVLSSPEQWPQLGAEFEGQMVFVSGGVVTPLKLGPGLSIRDGVLYVTGGAGEPEVPVGAVTTEVVDGDLRVYLDGVEVVPVVDASGDLTWPGLELVVDEAGDATLKVKED